jgi:dipeptidyl aminopeptidase/acylaminoacyl peptidase
MVRAMHANIPGSWFLVLSFLVSLLPACGGPKRVEEPVGQSTADPGVPSPTAGAAARASDDLISRKLVFGNPTRTAAEISPDGSQLAFLAPVDGVLNLWVAPIGELDKARAVTSDKGRGIQNYFWTWDGGSLLYIQDKNGDENHHLYKVDLKSNEVKDLTPQSGVQVRVMGSSHKQPQKILIGLNDRDARWHDLYELDFKSGDKKLLVKNERFQSFLTDENLKVVGAIAAPTPKEGTILFRGNGSGDWKKVIEWGMEDSFSTSAFMADPRGKDVYMIDSRGRDKGALAALSLSSGTSRVLYEPEQADASDVLFHPTKRTPQAVEVTYDKSQWKVLDKSIDKDMAALADVSPGEFTVSSRTVADDRWIVLYNLDDAPSRYYLYDRKSGKATFLFTTRPDLENAPLVAMTPVVIPARDGLKLVSYLSVPKSADKDGDQRPDEPVPMVLLVHGGPWWRDSWGYNPLHQWLANRGYAVLSVNFRGSTGFGKQFLNAANLEWGRKMHDDLLDAVKWAVDEKIAPQNKIAIMGGSYGGYAALVGLAFTPETFACGVDIVGPSNLETLLATIPPYWAAAFEDFALRTGDPRTAEGKKLLMERSPLYKADAIKKPLLIGQGANDPRVKQAESDQIVKALEGKDVPVTYVLYSDEGHGFVRPENRMSFFAITEAFLSQCLGGQYQPIGDDFKGSSVKVVTGGQYIPGLDTKQ